MSCEWKHVIRNHLGLDFFTQFSRFEIYPTCCPSSSWFAFIIEQYHILWISNKCGFSKHVFFFFIPKENFNIKFCCLGKQHDTRKFLFLFTLYVLRPLEIEDCIDSSSKNMSISTFVEKLYNKQKVHRLSNQHQNSESA